MPTAVELINTTTTTPPTTKPLTNADWRSRSFDARKAESARLRDKYPDRVPVVVDKARSVSSDVNAVHRYLVPHDVTVGQFVQILRGKAGLAPTHALYVFFGRSVLAPASASMADVDRLHRDPDGFLYAVYAQEATFGGGLS